LGAHRKTSRRRLKHLVPAAAVPALAATAAAVCLGPQALADPASAHVAAGPAVVADAASYVSLTAEVLPAKANAAGNTARPAQAQAVTYTVREGDSLSSIAQRFYHDTDAPALAKTFTDLLDRYGRSFELGLASRFYLFNKPLALLRMGPLGLSMFTRGRMSLVPKKIKRIEQLQAIVKKARELGEAS